MKPLRMGRRGASALEFALVAPALLLLCLGAYDLGRQIEVSVRLGTAARAGAHAAAASPQDEAAIRAAVAASWPVLASSEIGIACLCDTAEQACSAACGGVRIVTVSATRTLVPVLVPSAAIARGSAAVRL